MTWGLRIAGFAAAMAFAVATVATAQVQTGSILVKAADEQGAVLPGATVTITSPALVAGSMTGATDSGGIYRFPSLPAGEYTVKVEMQEFQTFIRENIVVQVGQTTPVDFALRLAALAEAITVTGESPVVDTTSANVNVTLDQKLLQTTPVGRDIWSLVEYKVPGLVSSRPDVGGTSGGLQGGMTARGTPNSQNAQFLNGINVGDPAAIGFAGFYYDYDAFEEIQVSTGAHDISVPGSGVFLNMTTKTGGNTWSGKASFFWEGNSTQSRNVSTDLLAVGFKPETNRVDKVSDISAQVGGPLIKDKLRLFAAFRDWRVHVNVPAAFSESVLDETNMTSGLANATWQLNQNNRFTGFYSRQYYKKPNRFLASSALYTSESNSNEDDVFDIVQGLWNSVLSNRAFFDARVSFNKIFFPLYFNGTRQSLTDLSTGILLGNEASEQIFIRKRLQASGTFNYYVDNFLGGRHELRFGLDHAHAPTSTEVHRWDDVAITYRSATNTPANVTIYNTPVLSKATVDTTAVFFQDSYSIQRLTVTGGVRWERMEGYLPEQSSPPSRYFPDLPRSFDAVHDIPLWHTLGPRVSAANDLEWNGTTALKFSAGRYYYIISTGTPNNVNPNFSVSRQYAWSDANHDLQFQDGEQAGIPVQAGGLTTSFDPGIKRPYTNEVTAGMDRELMRNLKLSTVFTYRVERLPVGFINTAAPVDTWVPITRADTGPDGLAGTGDDSSLSYFDRTVAGTQTLVTNDPEQRQTYKGLEITATRRLANRWQMLAGYTYSHARIKDITVAPTIGGSSAAGGPIAAPGSNSGPNAFINVDGPVFNDRPHQLKISGTYIFPWEVYVAANYRLQSGPPVSRQLNSPLSFGGGTVNINVEPQGSHRLDPLKTLDLRAAKTFRVGGTGRELEANIDVFNLTNANTVWEVRTLSGRINVRQNGDPIGALNNIPQFLSPTQILAPRIVRFGVALRF